MFNIKDERCKPRPVCLVQLINWKVAAMLRDVIVVAHTRPRAIPLVIFAMRKAIHGFLSVWASPL